eukprot:TRINITY_DN12346_c2_g1_i1.p1 TRINITY_DN12346_c2_g1~~TRINITY_DN12346_c2_g1_i1.p1  ORF type:complete len:412 (+),score=58.95 TRINITY_DN12346_c2_g1_i1:55-1236(+)
MVPFSSWHIDDKAVEGLSKYRYSGTDLSLLSKYVMQRYWRWAITLFPKSMAPNLITLCGTGMIIASYMVLSIYSPECVSDVPGWCYIFTGICLFGYQTFDALDGKQARRTGTSSPLGELFDHGCDAVGTHLISLNTMCAIMLPPTQMHYAFWYVLLLSGGFYFCAWEQYHTGTLTLGYANGPVEGILLAVSIYLATGFLGNDFWMKTEVQGLPLAHWLLMLTAVMGVFTLSGNTFNAVTASREGKLHPIATIAPVLVMVFSALLLQNYHSEYVLGAGFRTVCCCYGMAIANCCSKFVISHICGIHDSVHPSLMIPVIGFPLSALLYIVFPQYNITHELIPPLDTFMFSYLIILCVMYLHLVFSVCHVICKALGINTLTMTEKQLEKAMQMKDA